MHTRPLNAPLRGHDVIFVWQALRLHPEYEVKVGCGLKTIWIKPAVGYPKSRGFFVERQDGTFANFSLSDCINPLSVERLVAKAMRKAIWYQIIEFRDSVFDKTDSVICPFTGKTLTRHDCHIDHAPPYTFEVIKQKFLSENKLTPDDVKLRSTVGDGNRGSDFADEALLHLWTRFHRQHATLRVVSQSANLTIVKDMAKAI